MFHPIKGQNILLDESRNKASWCPVRTGGCFFSETPLKYNYTVSLLLDGTGGIEIGVIESDPNSFVDNVPVVTADIADYKTVTDVRLHRRTCRISVILDTSRAEVVSTFEGEKYAQTIDTEKEYWLALDVQYGEVDVQVEETENAEELRGDEIKFSHIHGPNIQIWNDKSTVRSIEKSPAALCFYNSAIKQGTNIILNCLPCPWHGTVPGRYYLKMVLYNENPDELQNKVPSKFDVSKQDFEKCQECFMHVLSKEECTGEVLINNLNEKLVITDINGSQVRLSLKGLTANDIWLGFELYGISVEIKPERLFAQKSPSTARSCLGPKSFQNKLQPQEKENAYNPTQESNIPHVHPVQNRPAVDQYDLDANIGNDVKDLVNLKASIQSNFVFLVNNFEISDCLDYFVQAGLTDIDEMNRLLQLYDTDKKNARRQVLAVLSKRQISKRLFIDMLENSNQMHLKEKFFCKEPKD